MHRRVGEFGLQDHDVEAALAILNGGPAPPEVTAPVNQFVFAGDWG